MDRVKNAIAAVTSRVQLLSTVAFDAVIKVVGSTAFRHRLVVVLVPFAVEIITAVQSTVTGATPDVQVRVAIDTAALFVINWLRGKAAPA